MLLPYASDHLPTRRPVVTWTLLAVNVALTLWLAYCDRAGGSWNSTRLFNAFGVVPARFSPLTARSLLDLTTLLTYSFFHEGFGHLLLNVFYLWVFGGGVEEAVGRARFLLWYLAGGVVGGVLQVVMTNLFVPANAGTPIIGASAACAGLVGLFAVRYYRTRIAFVGLPFRPHVVTVVTLFLAYETGSGLYNILTGSTAGGVAHWAHVGGFLFGLVCGQLLRLDAAGARAYLTQDAAKAMDKSVPGAAIRRWEILLAREPNNATARAELARAWLLLGDTEQAGNHYLHGIELYLKQNHPAEAALLYAEIREKGLRAPALTTEQLFLLGSALEELEEFALAAETLRAAATRAPDDPATETALLKVITLYVHRLNRQEEANILLRLFLERYPRSQWRHFAEELGRASAVPATRNTDETPQRTEP